MKFNLPTLVALYFTVGCVAWLTFKHVEPRIYPVISDFTIEVQEINNDNVVISGSFTKHRNCEFNAVLAYDDKRFINVDFPTHTQHHVSRLVREQTYRSWVLTPKSDHITLYATHQCDTGLVITELNTLHL